jgi:hypothetical protein
MVKRFVAELPREQILCAGSELSPPVLRKLEFDDHTIPQKQRNGSNRGTSNDAGLTLVTHRSAAAIGRVRQIDLATCVAEIGTAGGRSRYLRRAAGSSRALPP